MATNIFQGSLDEDIYLGFWINRSFGVIRGATLTLDRNRGGLLIAFLALFVSASGRSFWKLARCCLYYVNSTNESSDGVHLQRQAILRNTSLPLDAALEFTSLYHSWRRRANSTFRRTFLPAFLALVLATSFIVAGIFSSRVSNNSANETLIAGKNCDTKLPGLSYVRWGNEQYITPFLNRKAAEHLAYALQCYQNEGAGQSDSCKVMTVPKLPYTYDGNASCPFAAEMCKQPFGNFMFDTGPLHSYKHLGLNKGPPVTLQVKEHCAPLTTDGFSSSFIDPRQSYLNFRRFHYGAGYSNYTFQVAVNSTAQHLDIAGDYKVYAVGAGYAKQPWIPQLNQSGTVTTLYFMVPSSVLYLNRTEDPWFAATTPASGKFDSMYLPVDPYLPNDPATVLGCTSERIYCNPNQQNASRCLNLWETTEDDFRKAWPDPEDRLALRPLSIILQQFGAAGLKSYFDAKSVSSLLARQTLYPVDFGNTNYTTVQTKALPSDQWQKELEYVGQATLSAIQHFIVDYARGAWLGGGMCEDEPCIRTCYSQKVRSSKHYSFSVLGVGIILAGGGFIMVAAMLLEPILAGLFKLHWFDNNPKMRYAYAEWQAGSTLQLQRLAHEGVGAGTWSNTTGTVPLTQPGETLAVLDISDRTHARLVLPSVELTKVDYADTSLTKRPSVRYAKLPSSEQM